MNSLNTSSSILSSNAQSLISKNDYILLKDNRVLKVMQDYNVNDPTTKISNLIITKDGYNIEVGCIDEVHEMADSKRGSQLSLALERLRLIVGRDFQIIGLSATIGTPEKVAKFLVGNDREVEIVRVPVARHMKF